MTRRGKIEVGAVILAVLTVVGLSGGGWLWPRDIFLVFLFPLVAGGLVGHRERRRQGSGSQKERSANGGIDA